MDSTVEEDLGLTWEKAQIGEKERWWGPTHRVSCVLFSTQPGIRNLMSKPQVIVVWTSWGEETPDVPNTAEMP